MVTTASPDTYHRVIEYGLRKTSLRFDRLLLQAFMAGVYIGLSGQACNVFAGSMPTDSTDTRAVSFATQKFLYASIFPTAFVAIIFTGAELFTGNTMTMLICLFERRITFLHLLINWVGSFLGNWLGALFSAYFLSYLPGGYDQEPLHTFMCYLQHTKLSYSFGECFLRGVGCNSLVCLAVWNVTACDDPAGKILSMWFPIVAFVLAGYEHIIANFYTLQLSLFIGCPESIGSVILKNFVPTLLGNMVGGCVLIGAVYWYNFYPVEDLCYSSRLAGGPKNAGAGTAHHPSLLGTAHAHGSAGGPCHAMAGPSGGGPCCHDGDYDFPISRVHSRASVSPSILGLGAKQNTTFGGAPPPPTQWSNYDHARCHSECASNAGSVAAAAAAAGNAAAGGNTAAAGGGAAAAGTPAAAGAFHTAVFPKPRTEQVGDDTQQQQA